MMSARSLIGSHVARLPVILSPSTNENEAPSDTRTIVRMASWNRSERISGHSLGLSSSGLRSSAAGTCSRRTESGVW